VNVTERASRDDLRTVGSRAVPITKNHNVALAAIAAAIVDHRVSGVLLDHHIGRSSAFIVNKRCHPEPFVGRVARAQSLSTGSEYLATFSAAAKSAVEISSAWGERAADVRLQGLRSESLNFG